MIPRSPPRAFSANDMSILLHFAVFGSCHRNPRFALEIRELHYVKSLTPRKEAKNGEKEAKSRHGITQHEATWENMGQRRTVHLYHIISFS